MPFLFLGHLATELDDLLSKVNLKSDSSRKTSVNNLFCWESLVQKLNLASSFLGCFPKLLGGEKREEKVEDNESTGYFHVQQLFWCEGRRTLHICWLTLNTPATTKDQRL